MRCWIPLPQQLTLTPPGPTQSGRVLAWGQDDSGVRVWTPDVGRCGLQSCPQRSPAASAHGVTPQILDCRDSRVCQGPSKEQRPRGAEGLPTQPSLQGQIPGSMGPQPHGRVIIEAPGWPHGERSSNTGLGCQPRSIAKARLQPPCHTLTPRDRNLHGGPGGLTHKLPLSQQDVP